MTYIRADWDAIRERWLTLAEKKAKLDKRRERRMNPSTVEDVKDAHIEQTLREMRAEGATYKSIADALGISKKTLWERRKEYDLLDL